jgi:hypothetical protein
VVEGVCWSATSAAAPPACGTLPPRAVAAAAAAAAARQLRRVAAGSEAVQLCTSLRTSRACVPSARHQYPDRNPGLTEISLRF